MKKLIFLLFILIIPFCIASCEDGQIDINSASAGELDDITGIGPAKAGKIIEARPFDAIDSLIGVWGIGEATLQKIKEQGLVCVGDDNSEEESEDEDEPEQESEPEPDGEIIIINPSPKEKIITKPEVIKLNYESQKDIKTEENNSNKSKYAIYGLWFFCILIVLLLVLRKNRFNKNEFN